MHLHPQSAPPTPPLGFPAPPAHRWRFNPFISVRACRGATLSTFFLSLHSQFGSTTKNAAQSQRKALRSPQKEQRRMAPNKRGSDSTATGCGICVLATSRNLFPRRPDVEQLCGAPAIFKTWLIFSRAGLFLRRIPLWQAYRPFNHFLLLWRSIWVTHGQKERRKRCGGNKCVKHQKSNPAVCVCVCVFMCVFLWSCVPVPYYLYSVVCKVPKSHTWVKVKIPYWKMTPVKVKVTDENTT